MQHYLCTNVYSLDVITSFKPGYEINLIRGILKNLINNIMKRLKTSFNKNGLEYTLIKRTEKIALFRLGSSKHPDGYEVCRIYIRKAHKAFGTTFEESEVISSNDKFLADGSGSFRDLHNALRHYDKLSERLVLKEYVDDLKHSHTEEILEFQPVEDSGF
jgi:hypothetical protein